MDPRRYIHWTPRRKADFLVALSATGSVATAVRHVKGSRAAAYNVRVGDPAFALAWDAALGRPAPGGTGARGQAG